MSEEEIKTMALKIQSALLEGSYQMYQKLEQENTQLKEENERYRKLGFKHLNERNEHLESVLKEIRDCLEKNKFAYANPLTRNIYNVSRCDEVLEIIDKGIGEDK